MRLESPSIKLPSGGVHSYRLGFTHYIASELGWDGGNVKLCINGGAYAVVPSVRVLLQRLQRDAADGGSGQHEPARRPAGLHRHATAVR